MSRGIGAYANLVLQDEEWHIDVMALHIINDIFLKYQEKGEFPEYISYNV
ncbi:hypothetical protein [Ohessyouella blattaphilus]|uniref:Uncharacterized protein n=1 Tax=Ohessyouella blattaphilus TaxID=2949333 RepID=A0ABT1EII0_9FIRM|nr:hypothetical protein [Ohessyouella blattaphilus]MCP1110513.1 hypothetical protein [Ohessyouella blattaphilus]MCR8563907.1 hypothetical protein [Ohessyouella blattaphilus]MDL2249489.1 hypothetical protein [Lachnospiraceae bacterium OttesenSCG-928-J05]